MNGKKTLHDLLSHSIHKEIFLVLFPFPLHPIEKKRKKVGKFMKYFSTPHITKRKGNSEEVEHVKKENFITFTFFHFYVASNRAKIAI